jgi:ATP-dependent Zn protease
MWIRFIMGNPVSFGWPDLPPDAAFWLPGIVIVLMLGAVLVLPMLGNGRSPHTVYLPEQIEIGFDDVKGLGSVVREVKHTLEVFLNHQRFRTEMGGTPRRGVLFEGPPGTGKTHIGKAMAKEAGVPFLFVSSTSFQSMWYGATARRIRSFFRELRKLAREQGGAIGFIEEIDAIGLKRGGMSFSPSRTAAMSGAPGAGVEVARSAISEGTGGVVNELLVQLQSFDEPTRFQKFRNGMIRRANRYLPAHRQLKTAAPLFSNVLVIGATNRADSLDPALLRPGRFDRILHFGLPSKRDRRELVDYFLDRKAHLPGLDEHDARDTLAAATMGYTPAALERLFDEALLLALRQGRKALTLKDLKRAQMEVEIGLPNPVDYPMDERHTIATHEAGHATVAYLVGKGRRLEVLSIIKRRDSLGLLAHRETEERYTKRLSEMRALLQISFGGMVAEEVYFGESGTGPAGDLQAATQLAADMVGSYGLGDSLISFRSIDAGVMGGNLVAKVLADDQARKTVDQLLKDSKAETLRLISEHRYLVEALRDALLEREELYGSEITEVLAAAEAEALQSGAAVVDLRLDAADIVEPNHIEFQPLPEPVDDDRRR